MKKYIFGLVALLSVSQAVASNYIGASVSIKNSIAGLNLHFQDGSNGTSSLRYGLDLESLSVGNNGVALGGTVAYIADFAVKNGDALRPYYGAGLGASFYSAGDQGGIGLYPHVLAGVRYNIADPLSLFGEVNAGPAIAFGGSSLFTFNWGARAGLNYRLK